jgi:hypothetical protein
MMQVCAAALICLSLFAATVAAAMNADVTLTATVLRRVAVTTPGSAPVSIGRPFTPTIATNAAVTATSHWAEDDLGRYLLVTVVLED